MNVGTKIICPNCEEDITYYYKCGFKNGYKQGFIEIKEIINDFLDKYTIKSLIPKGKRMKFNWKPSGDSHYILVKDFRILLGKLK